MYIALKELSETPHTQGILRGYLECLREMWCLVVGVWNVAWVLCEGCLDDFINIIKITKA